MNKKLKDLKEKAIRIREGLTYDKKNERCHIGKLDKIIRGTVLVKWMHLFSAIFFFIFATFFTIMMYPEVRMIILMLGFAAVGYAISLLGVIIQMKLYERTVNKIQLVLKSP